MLLRIPVYNDAPNPVAEIFVEYGHINSVARGSGLEWWIPESVGYYSCRDGAVLVIWGSVEGKTRINGVVLPLESLREDSHFKRTWLKTKAERLTVAEVHAAILASQGQLLN